MRWMASPPMDMSLSKLCAMMDTESGVLQSMGIRSQIRLSD